MFPYEYIRIEKMSAQEVHSGCAGLSIQYYFYNTLFGKILVASTNKGICYLGFSEDENAILPEMKQLYPNAEFRREGSDIQETALEFFISGNNAPKQIILHLKGSEFQIKVWEALLRIPMGELATYSQIAEKTGKSKACRAAGSAVGANPVSLLIPCHRVVRASGEWGNYHWGANRKAAIIRWEKEQLDAMK